MNERLRIAEELLGCPIMEGGFARCPGIDLHTTSDGARDFRVILDGAPTGYCFHASCAERVQAFNDELRRRIWRAENGDHRPPESWDCQPGVAREPKADVKKRPPLDLARVNDFVRGTPDIDAEWLRKRSPVEVSGFRFQGSGVQPALVFLEALYKPDERVLVFTRQESQGDFLVRIGEGLAGLSESFRLAQERGVKAARSALPAAGPEGVWFLVQPVTGQWMINPKRNWRGETQGQREAQGERARGPSTPLRSAQDDNAPRWTRRSECNVTAWRYFVLESDRLDARLWLRVLVNLPMPVAAVYTSGRRSIHALLKGEVSSKGEWDQVRNLVRQIVCPLGADGAALSAVRLSRLPGCRRGLLRDSPMQELLYLNPDPGHEPLRLAREAR